MTIRMMTVGAVLFAAACASNSGKNPMVGDDGPAPDAPPAVTAEPTIFTIVLENKNDESVIGSANAPYLNSLVAMGGLATNYKDTIHPSLGNYLDMVSGDNQYPGIIDLGPKQWPYFPADKQHLGTQLEAAGIAWRSYQESMGTPCKLVDEGRYVTRHDPFIYFTDIQENAALCAERNVDYDQFAADLASNAYRYMWLTPNLDDDGHDPTTDAVMGLRDADAWMSREVPKILASDGFRAGGVLMITWDEDEGLNDEKVPMIVLSPRLEHSGMTVGDAFTHASYLATVEDLLALPRLPTVTATPSMMMFFH